MATARAQPHRRSDRARSPQAHQPFSREPRHRPAPRPPGSPTETARRRPPHDRPCAVVWVAAIVRLCNNVRTQFWGARATASFVEQRPRHRCALTIAIAIADGALAGRRGSARSRRGRSIRVSTAPAEAQRQGRELLSALYRSRRPLGATRIIAVLIPRQSGPPFGAARSSRRERVRIAARPAEAGTTWALRFPLPR